QQPAPLSDCATPAQTIDLFELNLPGLDNLPVTPPPAPASTLPLGDLVIRLDVMGLDFIIQGLERAANTGRLEFFFDDGAVAQAQVEGANLDDITDAQIVNGGLLFF